MWEENNFAVSLRVKRGHGYFLLTSLIVPVSGIFSSFDRVARNVPLDEEMNNVRSMGPDRPNNANLCPKKWWRYNFDCEGGSKLMIRKVGRSG